MLCLNTQTGQWIWKHAFSARDTIHHPVGPRSTPAIDEGHVDTVGQLFSLEGRDETGAVAEKLRRMTIWSHPAFAMTSVFARNDKQIVRVSLAE